MVSQFCATYDQSSIKIIIVPEDSQVAPYIIGLHIVKTNSYLIFVKIKIINMFV